MFPTFFYPINLPLLPCQIPIFSPPSTKDESQISLENKSNKKIISSKKNRKKIQKYNRML